MINPDALELSYQSYMQNLSIHIPEGVIEINSEIASNFGISEENKQLAPTSDQPYCYFYVKETSEKITLMNEEFVVWIKPTMHQEKPATYVFVALNQLEKPKLELAFLAKGVYNHPNLVLRILEAYLCEIKENDALIHELDRS